MNIMGITQLDFLHEVKSDKNFWIWLATTYTKTMAKHYYDDVKSIIENAWQGYSDIQKSILNDLREHWIEYKKS